MEFVSWALPGRNLVSHQPVKENAWLMKLELKTFSTAMLSRTSVGCVNTRQSRFCNAKLEFFYSEYGMMKSSTPRDYSILSD
jgi:hypothetical protein